MDPCNSIWVICVQSIHRATYEVKCRLFKIVSLQIVNGMFLYTKVLFKLGLMIYLAVTFY